jgi:hypothetical protein
MKRVRELVRRPVFAIGVLASAAALLSLFGMWVLGMGQLVLTFKGGLAVAYFSFLSQCYLDKKPIRVRDGSSVSLAENPILYRAIYLFFAAFGLGWGALLLL